MKSSPADTELRVALAIDRAEREWLKQSADALKGIGPKPETATKTH